MLTLTVKSIKSKDNATGTTFTTPESRGFREDRINNLRAIGADAIFDVDNYEYTVDETFAIVAAGIGIAKGGVSYAMGIIDMAVVGNRSIAVHDMLDALGNPIKLPKGAAILDGLAFVKTTFVSATNAGTIALGVEIDGAAMLKAAIAISNGAAPWTIGAKTALIPVGTAATAQTALTIDQKLQFTVAVEAMTAGKMVVFVMYILDPTAV